MAFASPPPSLLVLIARSAACGSSSLLAAALHRAADVMARAEHDGACAPCAAAPAPAQQRQSAALQALVLVPAWAASDAMPAVSALPALQRRDWAAADAAAGGAAVAPLLRRLVRAQGIAHFHSALSRLRLVSVASLADVTANLARVHAPAWAPTPASSPEPAAPVVPAAAAVPASAAAADAQVWRVLEISPAPARASAHELPAAPMIVVVHGLDALVERTCGGGGGAARRRVGGGHGGGRCRAAAPPPLPDARLTGSMRGRAHLCRYATFALRPPACATGCLRARRRRR